MDFVGGFWWGGFWKGVGNMEAIYRGIFGKVAKIFCFASGVRSNRQHKGLG